MLFKSHSIYPAPSFGLTTTTPVIALMSEEYKYVITLNCHFCRTMNGQLLVQNWNADDLGIDVSVLWWHLIWYTAWDLYVRRAAWRCCQWRGIIKFDWKWSSLTWPLMGWKWQKAGSGSIPRMLLAQASCDAFPQGQSLKFLIAVPDHSVERFFSKISSEIFGNLRNLSSKSNEA